jgi:pimeloyl-ACP methyl ester carboxylesterase
VTSPVGTTFDHRVATSGGVQLHCVTAGPADGPLVVLIHGFPARWSTWREPMAALAGAGLCAVAPDMRGYGESGKPVGVGHYSAGLLVDDVVSIVRAFGREQAFVAGHDFGGGVAWATAMRHPEIVDRLATLNAVHPVGFKRQMRHWSQLRKSWYVLFFQLPWLPEMILSRQNLGLLRRSLADDGLSSDSVVDLLEGVRHPGALRAAINWYRAGFRDVVMQRLAPSRVDIPTLVVWGDRERYFDPELADPPPDWVTNARVVHIPGGSHWVHHDAPEKVSALLIDHFRSHPASPPTRATRRPAAGDLSR